MTACMVLYSRYRGPASPGKWTHGSRTDPESGRRIGTIPPRIYPQRGPGTAGATFRPPGPKIGRRFSPHGQGVSSGGARPPPENVQPGSTRDLRAPSTRYRCFRSHDPSSAAIPGASGGGSDPARPELVCIGGITGAG